MFDFRSYLVRLSYMHRHLFNLERKNMKCPHLSEIANDVLDTLNDLDKTEQEAVVMFVCSALELDPLKVFPREIEELDS
jgi:hypothetical protein